MRIAALVAGLVALAAARPAVALPQEPSPVRWVATADRGASLLNLPNASGRRVLDLGPGQVLAVFSETPDFLEVEAPSGLQVWVWGQYLRPTNVENVLELTGDRVLMRPAPNGNADNFPLPSFLYTGERVWSIERADEGKSLSEDWVRVWSPAGKHAYVAKASTRALASNEDGRGLWNAQRAAALDARLPQRQAAKSAPVENKIDQRAREQAEARQIEETRRESVRRADEAWEAAKASGKPDFAVARAGYEAVIASGSEGYFADLSRARLKEIEIYEELHRARDEASTAREHELARQAELQRQLEEARRAKNDPLWGRYQSRGWVERLQRRGEPDAFVIQWAGETQSELVCSSGRYDLSLYEGFEVGVVGGASRAPIAASASSRPRPIQFDVLRLEVISARPRR